MTNEEIQRRVCELISTLFEVPSEELDAASSPKTVSRWDSMAQLTLVLELEQEFSLQFAPEEVEKMTSIGGIAQVIAARG